MFEQKWCSLTAANRIFYGQYIENKELELPFCKHIFPRPSGKNIDFK